MVRFEAWPLKGLLGLMCALPVWMSSQRALNEQSQFCISLEALNDKLNSSLRRQYLKQNFPINYTIQVRYEEVFRLKNVSRLLNDSEEIVDLQYLWLSVTERNIKNILNVLPERHPSRRRYLKDLESLFTAIKQSYPQSDEDTSSESIANILDRLDQEYHGWKSVTPKSLLDNCYRTMHCLFKECFSSQYDYCNPQHWRKGKGTQG